jgi:hypothetical protein
MRNSNYPVLIAAGLGIAILLGGCGMLLNVAPAGGVPLNQPLTTYAPTLTQVVEQPPTPTAVTWPTLVPSATPWPKPSREGFDQLVQIEQKYTDHYSVDLTGTIAFSTYLEAYSSAYSVCESYNFYKHSHVETAAEQAMMLAAQEFMTTQNCPQ